jgi:hypothetical protein
MITAIVQNVPIGASGLRNGSAPQVAKSEANLKYVP